MLLDMLSWRKSMCRSKSKPFKWEARKMPPSLSRSRLCTCALPALRQDMLILRSIHVFALLVGIACLVADISSCLVLRDLVQASSTGKIMAAQATASASQGSNGQIVKKPSATIPKKQVVQPKHSIRSFLLLMVPYCYFLARWALSEHCTFWTPSKRT